MKSIVNPELCSFLGAFILTLKNRDLGSFVTLKLYHCKANRKATNTLFLINAAKLYQPNRCSSNTAQFMLVSYCCMFAVYILQKKLQRPLFKTFFSINPFKCIQRSPYKMFATSTLYKKSPL